MNYIIISHIHNDETEFTGIVYPQLCPFFLRLRQMININVQYFLLGFLSCVLITIVQCHFRRKQSAGLLTGVHGDYFRQKTLNCTKYPWVFPVVYIDHWFCTYLYLSKVSQLSIYFRQLSSDLTFKSVSFLSQIAVCSSAHVTQVSGSHI